MTTLNEKARCQRGVWILAGIVGLIVFILGLTSWHMWWPSALFWGAVVFLLLGLFLGWAFCRGKSDGYETSHPAAAASKVWDGGTSDSSEPATASSAASADTVQVQEASASDVGEVEPATASHTTATQASAGDASDDVAATNTVVDIKPSASLAGEQELSERKGEWKYEASSSDMPNGAATADAASAATVASVEETEDYDGDGVKEGTDEGSRPEALTAARDGGADNLKEIKGIGPALERLCNELGIYHFDQIAGWSADEVAWMNANLKGFKGRVSRDNWVEQAKILAAGGETEFSKRVEDGGVY